MKTQTKHTPVPWEFDPKELTIWQKDIRDDRDMDCAAEIANNVDPEDGEFIVRAVNAHEELLEASKTMIGFLKKPMDLRSEDDLKQIILNMKEAIAKAEGN